MVAFKITARHQPPPVPTDNVDLGNLDHRLVFPATARNREPIAAVLSEWLPRSGLVLEVASGSGEHAVTFQNRFPDLIWQASDLEPEHRRSIDAWIAASGLDGRMPSALDLDVQKRPWDLPEPVMTDLAALVCINLLHISPADCTRTLLMEAARFLPQGAPLIIYGPFKKGGCHVSESNAIFDQSLKDRNPCWGVRDLEWVMELASERHAFERSACITMPANNLTIVLSRN